MTGLIDVTVPMSSSTPVFPGDPPFTLERVLSLADGGVCNLSRLDAGVHTGTHIDAPVHFIDGGAGVETTPLDALLGPAYVVDARAVTGHIDAATLQALDIPPEATRLLFRTRNSPRWSAGSFLEDFVAVAPDAAALLADRGVRLVGNDYLSIAPYGDPAPTHVALLTAGVVVLEGVDLARVDPGWHDLICLPILLVGADGAPARTLLRRR